MALAERSYDIRIKPGVLGEIGQRLSSLGVKGKVGVVTNSIVGRLYAPGVLRSLRAAGWDASTIVLPDGERAKSMRSVSAILDSLVTARFERGSVLVALGGGVIGDLTGFAASIYMRGIPFVQVPTTLVAQVDSSVGGKTGVNHPLGKNLIGTFFQPCLVLVDPDTLRTLPPREWVAGLAEVIKYGVIADETFFAYLEQHMDRLLKLDAEPVGHVIARSCEIKASVVERDERESDLRRILNYGHTIGHALESLGGYRKLIHGEAVAIGMVQEADLARHLGLCAPDVVERQRTLVRRAGLPDALPETTFGRLWAAMQHDKKVVQGRVYCVLPERIGRVVIQPLEREACRQWFEQQDKQKTHARRAAARLRR
ncbi:MAG: 3-dehydroquinate synthase [Nitrospirae bacterium RIFCSPLOWO2_01_FULL_62_17]|nr:MAG: 3-dehydroquinate synthase [Nitrospirae bacterium RIFCSPLOWO2_01_FULL_62_17]